MMNNYEQLSQAQREQVDATIYLLNKESRASTDYLQDRLANLVLSTQPINEAEMPRKLRLFQVELVRMDSNGEYDSTVVSFDHVELSDLAYTVTTECFSHPDYTTHDEDCVQEVHIREE